MTDPIALDVSLEKARALHRVWRAMNDGDCPKCHKYHLATQMTRYEQRLETEYKAGRFMWPVIKCPSCGFKVTGEEIQDIEKMFAPAMDAAVAIFEGWRAERGG